MSADFPTHWNLLPLAEAMEVIIDYRGKTPLKSEKGIPLITAKIVKSGRIENPTEFIDEEIYENWMVRGLPKIGDVIVTTEAPLGEVAQLNDANVALAQRIVTLRGKNGVLDNNFLLYLMQSKYIQEQLDSRASGSTVRGIKQSELRKITLPIPSEGEQIKIAKHLKTIDNKININRQINQNLEQIAQAIFKSWFVDFEPVKAKIAAKKNGQDPECAAMCAISGKSDAELNHLPADQLSQLATTAALFPDELVDSELGLVPKGWEVSTIGKEFEVTMGQSPPGHTYNETGDGTPFFQGRRDFGWRYPTNRVYCTAPKRFAKIGDTLLSVRAPVGDVNKATTDCCIGRGIAALRHISGCEAYTYYTVKKLEQYFNNFDTEGTVFGSINQKNLRAIKIIRPDAKTLKQFSLIAGRFDNQIFNLENEITSLTQLRDTLLPKLLSGEISVAETQAKIEAAV